MIEGQEMKLGIGQNLECGGPHAACQRVWILEGLDLGLSGSYMQWMTEKEKGSF